MLGLPESALRVDPASRTARPLLASRVFLCPDAGIESAAVKAFRVDDTSPPEFVRSVEKALGDWGLQGHTRLRLDGRTMTFEVRWMGTTELRFRLTESDGGFVAEPAGERVSPFHAAFRQAFEERFDQALMRVGARPVST